METKYLLNLEQLAQDFDKCYKIYVGNRKKLKSSLRTDLDVSVELFDRTATKLKRRPIIKIDRDVDYRHWGTLKTWTDQKRGIDPGIRESLQHLCTTLLDIADTIDAPPYDDKQYAYLYLLARRSYNICRGQKVACEYDKWKRGHFDSNLGENQYLNFVDETIEKLLNSGVFNGVRSNASKQDLNNYLKDFDFEGYDSKQKKIMLKLYCRFRDIYYKRNGIYSVNMANAGRLIFRLKQEPDKLEALLHFDNMLNRVNADIDTLGNTNRTYGNTPYDKQTLPQDCRDAVSRVMTDTFTVQPSGTVLNSRRQLVQAAGVVDTGSGAQLAMLKAIAVELKAVKPGCSRPDFVKALIGLGIISPTDKEGIERLANGIKKKENGRTHKGERPSPLSPNHRSWEIKDSEIGNKIYDIMRMRCN